MYVLPTLSLLKNLTIFLQHDFSQNDILDEVQAQLSADYNARSKKLKSAVDELHINVNAEPIKNDILKKARERMNSDDNGKAILLPNVQNLKILDGLVNKISKVREINQQDNDAIMFFIEDILQRDIKGFGDGEHEYNRLTAWDSANNNKTDRKVIYKKVEYVLTNVFTDFLSGNNASSNTKKLSKAQCARIGSRLEEQADSFPFLAKKNVRESEVDFSSCYNNALREDIKNYFRCLANAISKKDAEGINENMMELVHALGHKEVLLHEEFNADEMPDNNLISTSAAQYLKICKIYDDIVTNGGMSMEAYISKILSNFVISEIDTDITLSKHIEIKHQEFRNSVSVLTNMFFVEAILRKKLVQYLHNDERIHQVFHQFYTT